MWDRIAARSIPCAFLITRLEGVFWTDVGWHHHLPQFGDSCRECQWRQWHKSAALLQIPAVMYWLPICAKPVFSSVALFIAPLCSWNVFESRSWTENFMQCQAMAVLQYCLRAPTFVSSIRGAQERISLNVVKYTTMKFSPNLETRIGAQLHSKFADNFEGCWLYAILRFP